VSHSPKNLPRILFVFYANCRQFDSLIASYESLAQTTLFTLRLELRCHVIYFLTQTIREGNFGLTEDEVEEEELDPTIVELCKDLVSFEDLVNTTLESQESTSFPIL
jgi:exocyst complex component 4